MSRLLQNICSDMNIIVDMFIFCIKVHSCPNVGRYHMKTVHSTNIVGVRLVYNGATGKIVVFQEQPGNS